MIPVALMKFFGAAATHLSPGEYPDSKQPCVIIIIIKIIIITIIILIPAKKQQHQMY